jgi:hypothetical protein
MGKISRSKQISPPLEEPSMGTCSQAAINTTVNKARRTEAIILRMF